MGDESAVNYNGGEVRTAVGDFNGNGSNEIAVAQGYGGNGVIRIYTYTGQAAPNGWAVVGQFNGLSDNAQEQNANGGLSLAAGDLDGDGDDELLVGQTNSVTSQTIFHVLNINESYGIGTRYSYAGFEPKFRGNGGVEMVVADLNGDGQNEIIAASQGNNRQHGSEEDQDPRNTAPINVIGVIEPCFRRRNYHGLHASIAECDQRSFPKAINPSGSVSIAERVNSMAIWMMAMSYGRGNGVASSRSAGRMFPPICSLRNPNTGRLKWDFDGRERQQYNKHYRNTKWINRIYRRCESDEWINIFSRDGSSNRAGTNSNAGGYPRAQPIHCLPKATFTPTATVTPQPPAVIQWDFSREFRRHDLRAAPVLKWSIPAPASSPEISYTERTINQERERKQPGSPVERI